MYFQKFRPRNRCHPALERSQRLLMVELWLALVGLTGVQSLTRRKIFQQTLCGVHGSSNNLNG